MRPLLRVRAALVTLGLATSALLVLAAPTAARASGCGSDQVAVAVNFAHWGGPARVGCVAWSSSLTGYQALHSAGFQTAGTSHDGPAFICRIDNEPSAGAPDNEACRTTPPTSKYWSYWHANAGQTSWSYSTLGAVSYHPHQGSADAWTFGGGTAPPFSPSSVLPARGSAPTTARSVAPPATIARTRPKAVPSTAPGERTTTHTAATSASNGGPAPSTGSATTASTSSTAGTSAQTSGPSGASTSATNPATSGSTGAGGSTLTCTSTSTSGSTSGLSQCASIPPIVANTSAVASPAKASGSPLPTIAAIVIVAALAAGGGAYAWRRRAGTHGD